MEANSCIRLKADIKQIARCKSEIDRGQKIIEDFSSTLSLAGNTVRFKILFLLYREKQLCVCDLSDILEMNISAISQHLRKLKDKELIKTQREAQTIYYSLTEKSSKTLIHFFKIIEY